MDQANDLTAGDTRVVRQTALLQFQADNLARIWTTIVQAVVGVVLAVGAVATWRNLRVANEVQITNRFTQAIAQLGVELKGGQPNLEVRLGGIYALERIARDSLRDHWTIMEILTAYVRQNTSHTDRRAPPRIDIQAILAVLGRRSPPEEWPEPDRIDLSLTCLRGAHLTRWTSAG